MKKSAWTLAELTIAIIVLIILCRASMTISKNININKSKIFIYSAIRNLTMGNIAIMEMPANNESFYPDSAGVADNDSTVTNDWYCIYLADSFSLSANPNCSKTAANTAVNLRFPNGITFQGIASPWQTAYDGLYYKNIVIDADGEDGMNKVGVDRFPVRVFRGSTFKGTSVDGMVIPVECGNDVIYDQNGSAIALSTPYCTHGFTMTKGSANNKIASDDSVITQNIYRVTDGKNSTKATIIAGSLSTIAADCKAYAGKGFYSEAHCKAYGITLLERCAHASTCEDCATYGICPNGGSEDACNTLAESNKLDVPDADNPSVTEKTGFQCFTLINKPTAGMGMFGSAVLGDIDM